MSRRHQVEQIHSEMWCNSSVSKSPGGKKVLNESAIQKEYIKRIRMLEKEEPLLGLCFSMPNESAGMMSYKRTAYLKSMGAYTKGIPDIIFLLGADVFNCLMIEFKAKGKERNLSKEQLRFHALAREGGSLVIVSSNADEAFKITIEYLRKAKEKAPEIVQGAFPFEICLN